MINEYFSLASSARIIKKYWNLQFKIPSNVIGRFVLCITKRWRLESSFGKVSLRARIRKRVYLLPARQGCSALFHIRFIT